jgi:GTP-binding protein
MATSIRNIAIIAHVDHGKTTLVDQMFRQSGVFRDSEAITERLMDSQELERERGITISAKNCAIEWQGTKINILDTPGHADFGGEVERALMMVDGALLLVDSAEGPLPQTRFVLQKALARHIPVIVVINKIDRKDARPQEVLDEIYNLFIDLGADEDQLDCPIIYAVGRDGTASRDLKTPGVDLNPLFDAIINTFPPPPPSNPDEPFQMLVLDLGYSEYLGRLATGRVFSGQVRKSDKLVRIDKNGEAQSLKVVDLQVYSGPGLVPVESSTVISGEIVVLAGAADVQIGDTITTPDNPRALPRVEVEKPTIAMRFTPNTSPFSGQEGKHVQLPRIKERLERELLTNVSLQVEIIDEGFLVKGRGELQLAILIEKMRREGFEISISRPEVLTEVVNGVVMEPIEHLQVDCEEVYVGIITEKLSRRKGRMVNLQVRSDRARIEFSIPSRALIGLRSQFLTDTKGTGLLNSYLVGMEPYRGDFPARSTGSLVSDREGETVAYGLFNLEPRGRLLVAPGERVYEGMIIGEHNRDGDLNVNPTRSKALTNIRAARKDENVILTPIVPLSLEAALEFIAEDELVEVTPKSIRMRKKILSASKRK